MHLTIKSFRKVILNSGPRLKAYIKYNSNLSGGVYSLWDEEQDGNLARMS